MIKNKEIYHHRTHTEAHREHKKVWVMIILIGFLCINLITADLTFDNSINFYKDIGPYGKYEVRDWFGLQKLQDVELKENTDICNFDCSAKKEISMHQKGVLIDDVKFLIKRNGKGEWTEDSINDYRFFIIRKGFKIPYELGTEVDKGNYIVLLEGRKDFLDDVDWQIKIGGKYWTEDWATWTSSLSENLEAYWNMDDGAGITVTDNTGNGHDGTIFFPANVSWYTGKLGDALNFTKTSHGVMGSAYVNISNAYGLFNNSRNFSVSFWVYKNQYIDGRIFMAAAGQDASAITAPMVNILDSGGRPVLRMHDALGGQLLVISNNTFSANAWHHVVIVYIEGANATKAKIYVNGTSEPMTINTDTMSADGSQPLNFTIGSARGFFGIDGIIDEVGLWNRELTASEASDLYNTGAGITYVGNVVLNSPADNKKFIRGNIIFNCSVMGNVLTNISLFHNNTGAWHRNLTTIVSGDSNETTFTVPISNTTLWNCRVCDSAGCSFSASNKTLIISDGFEESQTYNTTTYETALEKFTINISYDSLRYNLINANFVYNKTSYTGAKSGSGNNIIFTKDLDIPIIILQKNITFHWEIGLINSSGTTYFNSTFYNQTVNNISLGSCAGATNIIALNFTSLDEEKLTRINDFDFKATFEYYIGNGTSIKNVSIDSSNIATQLICIDKNITYHLNAIIEYKANATAYITRNYYLENHVVNNVSQNISLILLNLTDSTSFILKVVNHNQQNVEDALIYTQRYYPGLGYYKTVQIAKTDENGKSVGFFKTETVDYRFLITRSGITELLTSRQKVVPEETPYTLLFTIGVALEKPWADFDDLDDLDYTLTFNSSTNITIFTYTDLSTSFTRGRLLVQKFKYNQTDIIICNSTSTDSSATITCDLTEYSGTFFAQGFIKRDTEKTVSFLMIVITTIVEIFGMAGLLLGWFIILVSGCAFIWHPIAGVVGVEASIIFVNIIGLVSFSPLFIFGSLAITVILIWVLKD